MNLSSILEEFARGNISPEPRFFKKDSHYGHTMKTLSDNEKALLDALDGDLKEKLAAYIDAQGEISVLSGVERFKYGYSLGVLMTVAALNNMENLLIGGSDR